MSEANQGIVLLCNYNGRNFGVTISRSARFEDVINRVKFRLEEFPNFNGKSLKEVSMSFSIGPVESITFANDHDITTLFVLASQFKTGYVNVSLNIKEDDIDHEFANQLNELSDDDRLSDDDMRDEENIPDYLEKYCHHELKTSRSDSWKEAIKEVGQIFENGQTEFKRELSKFAIKNGFEFQYKKNDLVRVTAVCKLKADGCNWHVHARLNKTHNYFYIRKLNNIHTCNQNYRKLKDYRMSSNIVAQEIKEYFTHKAIVSPKEIRDEFEFDYGVDISYSQAWRGVEIAKEAYYGEHRSTYDQLRAFMKSTIMANPDSQTFLEYDVQSSHFKRFFISFGPCIEGFNYCRPVLFLDGTFLKSRYKGILLAATGKDANKGIYPLAIAIVDSETENNWIWFMESLRNCIRSDRTITFISDRNKGLMEAVTKVFPDSPHGFCLIHLRSNLKDRLGGISRELKKKLCEMLWKAAQTPSREICCQTIDDMIVAAKGPVENFLNNAPLINWANSFFQGKRYGELYSNVAESFNKWIRNERNLPVKNMIDDIKKKMMKRMAVRRKLAANVTTILCPEYDVLLDEAKQNGATWAVIESNPDIYQVMSIPDVMVDLKNRTCSCCRWQILSFPCPHAVAVIIKTGKNIFQYIEDYYTTKYWYASHKNSILPTPTLDQETVQPEDSVVQPPVTKIPPGRPKKRRFVSRSEKYASKRELKCSRCGLRDHNKRTCSAPIL